MSKADEIPAISYIAEPLLVAGLLIAGCVFNRRKSSQLHILNTQTVFPARQIRPSFFKGAVRIPDTTVYAGRMSSRLLARFPFLMEVWYWLLTYWIYQISRAIQALTMGQETWAIAKHHAELIIWLERITYLDIELPLQRFVMARPMLLYFFNKTYAMLHIPATIAFFGYSFYGFPAPAFQRIRRTLVLCNCLAFVIFTLWPCMPPRLLPYDTYGYYDTLHAGKAASIWTTNKFQNQLAAFPSLHFGYSFVIGTSLYVYSPHRLLRIFGPAYPILILLVIMATANHYLLDAFGGALVSLAAHRFNTILLNLQPIEEWGFWLCRTDRPLDKEAFSRMLAGHAGEQYKEELQSLLTDTSPRVGA